MRARAAAMIVAAGLVGLASLPGAGASPAGPTARDIARDHVRTHAERYGVAVSDVGDLMLTDAYTDGHSGVTHVYLRQRIDGLQVAGSSAGVHVQDGEVIHVGARLVPYVDGASGELVLGAPDAAAAAAQALGLKPTAPFRTLRSERDADRTTLMSPGDIAQAPISAKLVYQALEDGRIRLAWNLEIHETSGEHWWNASIDAETGALLAKYDYVDHDDGETISRSVGTKGRGIEGATVTPDPVPDGSAYRVFALPLESPNDGDRTLVEEPADATASPYGWHDTDGQAGPEHFVTRGNNVHAYLDTASTGSAGVPLPGTDAQGVNSLTFDFPWHPNAPPTVNGYAAVTNLFYWNNIIHDVFYRYGFDEASGNFQVNNYGRGGLGNDYVQAEAQDGSGTNNANFATPTDGSRPRMQMYLWTTGAADAEIIDGDFDAGVITHEYGHGISNRLTGGPTTGGCLSSHDEREGEGWSDWLALALTAIPEDTGPAPRGMGTYVVNEDGREGDGIRITPYSTDMSINPSTYNRIKTAAEPHGVGYVWATMLWEVYWDLIEVHGFNPNVYDDWTTGGNNLAIQLVMDGMKFQPCEPGFADARDAILVADQALTDGANQCLIWRGFAKRGLGFSAQQNNPASKADGVEGYDTHPACQARATASPESLSVTLGAGGAATENLTVGNGALAHGEDLTWGITESATDCASSASIDWLSAAPTEGTTAAAGGSEVAVTIDATGLSSGSHAGSLCIVSNDATTPSLAVPVTLTVE